MIVRASRRRPARAPTKSIAKWIVSAKQRASRRSGRVALRIPPHPRWPAALVRQGGPTMAVITVSRQIGSGGSAIATRVAESLGYRLYDRQLLLDASEYIGVRPEALERVDEQHHGVVYSTLSTLTTMLDGPSMTEEGFQIIASDLIREIARVGNAVIVGRAAQCILRGYSPTFHVHIIAPFITRVERIAERNGVSLQMASTIVQES